MGLCLIMQKNDVMVADEWQDNGPRDLVPISLCIQIAKDEMQSVANACPHHNPTATMEHCVHDVDISKPLAIHVVCV